MRRKNGDQRQPSSCLGSPPPGFSRVDVEAQHLPTGRAPLHALFHEPEVGRPIVIAVHGLFDSKFSRYVTLTASALAHEGFGVLVPDMRWHGCLLTREWLPTLGIEESKDLVAWSSWLRAAHPGHEVGLLGFSLGGLDVLEAGGLTDSLEAFGAGVVAISPPAALRRTTAFLDAPSFVADRGLTVLIKRLFRVYLSARLQTLGIERANPPRFHDLVGWVAKEGPFPKPLTADELLALAEPDRSLSGARRPVLILATLNDPVFSEAAVAALAEAARANPYVRVLETPGGGHLGQIGLYPSWFRETIVTFFTHSSTVAPRN